MDAAPSISELFPSNSNTASGPRQADELGQEDFLKLMIAQLENQDPTKPLENTEFLSQMAQFSTVEGIQGIQEGFGNLSGVLSANQTLQAASLVGQKVVTESNLGVLADGETLDATIDLPQTSGAVTLYIQDMAGNLVHSRAMGPSAPGEIKVQWDGIKDDGSLALPGQYRVSAESFSQGQIEAVSVYTHSRVESVTIDGANGGVALNLAGGDQVSITEVKSFL
ncbi:MAG: flagellar hook assembly protein FlgD [Halioglobus sp.]